MAGTRLRRSREERLLAGVCAGLAEHLGVPVVWARGAMLVFALLGGAGAMFYLWLWITVPWEEAEPPALMRDALTRPARSDEVPHARVSAGVQGDSDARVTSGRPSYARGEGERPRGSFTSWPVAELLLGASLLFTGAGFLLVQLGVDLNLQVVLPAMTVLVGVGLTWWQVTDRDRPERNQVPRVLGALALVAVGVLTFFVTARQPSALTVISAALAVLAGVALAIAPWLLRLNHELIAERSARARDAERADIAAHLHDSVLQTLALIQQRSDPGSDVARIARGQERELREWLFRSADGGDPPATAAIDAVLGAHAAALEADHAVRFEIVAVGVGAETVVPEPIVAAAREAMLNAARHAGGAVTVYLEITPELVAVDVTDRGPGVDPEALPEGRMGIRESIFGRMERAGGSARILPGPGGSGTSVRLSMPRAQAAREEPVGASPRNADTPGER